MKFLKILAAQALATMLAFGIANLAHAAPHAGYTITDDRFEPQVTVISPMTVVTPATGQIDRFTLRSFVDKKTKAVTHQLYIDIGYSAPAWRFYNAVYDDHAQQHAVTEINRGVGTCEAAGFFTDGGCDYHEIIGADLSDDDMIAFAKSGVSFKLGAKSGFSEVVEFKPWFFAGQLAVLNDYVAKPYAVDLSSLPAADPGLHLYDVGHINKRLYYGVDHGLIVANVVDGSPAAEAGIKGNNVVIAIDGVPLDKMDDYKTRVAGYHAGQVIEVQIKQSGEIKTVKLAL